MTAYNGTIDVAISREGKKKKNTQVERCLRADDADVMVFAQVHNTVKSNKRQMTGIHAADYLPDGY